MAGLLNEASAPTPSAAPETPDPARGATVHVRARGSALLFVAHAEGHVQGMTLTWLGKPGQKDPAGQAAGTPAAATKMSAEAPAAQPGLRRHARGCAAPPVQKKPAEHKSPVTLFAPRPQKRPGVAQQGPAHEGVVRSVVLPYVP